VLLLIVVVKLVMGRTQGKLFIYKITTSNRRLIKQVKRRKTGSDRFTDPLPCEIDNHADTTCFGKIFRIIAFTSEVCSVSQYLSKYNSVNDIPICTAATAVELDTGETIILQFGQGLWFGDRLNHSLINPNQCRSYGISVCDDPADPNRDIGMELPDNYFLPFKMRRTTCYFKSRSPDVEELESCRTFQVSDANHWDPKDEISISAVGRGQNSVCLPVCVSEVCLHEFDLLQGSPTHIISQIQTSERHHGVDASLLSLKWGVGLEKAKNTIKNTTQYNIRSAILPLTRRYRTDLLSQRLRCLNTRFYTETIFFKIGTSLRGNTCAQVFTDGNGRVFVYPMKGKSEAGQQLISLIEEVGVPNELHRDGAPELLTRYAGNIGYVLHSQNPTRLSRKSAKTR